MKRVAWIFLGAVIGWGAASIATGLVAALAVEVGLIGEDVAYGYAAAPIIVAAIIIGGVEGNDHARRRRRS